MLLRKINACLSLGSTALVLHHAISLAVCMLSMGRIPPVWYAGAWVLLWLTAAHALLSIGLMISTYKDAGNRKGKSYPQLNIPTVVQRVSGAMMVVFTALHVAGASGAMRPPQLVHAIVPPLFFALVMAHVVVSTGKAFVTLGIGDARTVKAVDIAMKVICGMTLVADIVGFYLFVC